MEGTVARGAGTAPSSAAATVEFQHVSKSYERRGGASAVEDLSLEVPAGRICVLVGPSGCGKTTSLKMVNRLIEPSGGKILIDGVDAATRDVTELRRGIGYVIQQVGLFPHQTVSENVAVVPRLLGWPAARRAARSDELLSLVGLDPSVYGRRYPVQLSGGERQRVGVARALAADPPLMLMDEPFAAVDPIVRASLQDEFLRLQRELAKTILFVTHDIDEAIKMGDLVAVMQQGGHLAQYASPEELLARPASDFVARFVGADRGLKRLALSRIENLELEPVLTARMGEEAADVRRRATDAPFPYVLLVDFGGLPVGWIAADELPTRGPVDAGRVTPLSPLLEPHTTLKEAAARMIDADVQVGIVVDRTGRPTGLATLESIGQHLRRLDREVEASAGATARDTAAAAARA